MLPILLLHGALATADQMNDLVQRLVPDNAAAFTFSGHGLRAQEPLDFDRFVDEIEQYMVSHAMERVHLFGYSMGGYAALLFAARFPHRVASVTTLGTILVFTEEGLQRELNKLDPDLLAKKVPAFATRLAQLHGKEHWQAVVRGIALQMTDLARSPRLTEAVVARILSPVMCMVGSDDASADPERTRLFAEKLKATYTVLPDTKHPFESVDLDLLIPELRRFWIEVEGS